MVHRLFALVTTLIVIATSLSVRAQSPIPTATAQPGGEQRAGDERRPEYPMVYVSDLHCQTCAKRLARKLFAVPGVMKVRARLTDDVAIVIPQKDKSLSPLALWEAAEAANFKVVRIETPSNTYDKKPVELAKKQTRAPNTPTRN